MKTVMESVSLTRIDSPSKGNKKPRYSVAVVTDGEEVKSYSGGNEETAWGIFRAFCAECSEG